MLTPAGKFWITYGACFFGALFLAHSCAYGGTEKHGKTGEPQVETRLPRMPPDNWGGAKAHVLISAGIGTVTNIWLPDRPILAAALCMAPGLYREAYTYDRQPEPGYRHGLFSRKDLIANAAGCALGYGTAKGVRWLLTPNSAYLNVEF